MLALSFHVHPLIEAAVIHPLRHVAAAGWVVGLEAGVHSQYQHLGDFSNMSSEWVDKWNTPALIDLKLKRNPLR